MPQPPSPGRPRTFDEGTVLDAALDVFWRHGAVNTTTRTLEDELGITQSSIYNAFGSKRDLLGRAIDRYLERIDVEVVAPLDSPVAGPDELLAFVDDLLDWVSVEQRRGCMMLNIIAESGSGDSDLINRATAYRERLRAAFCRSLSAVDNSEERSQVMLAAVLGINIAARSGATLAELRAMAEALKSQIRGWAGA